MTSKQIERLQSCGWKWVGVCKRLGIAAWPGSGGSCWLERSFRGFFSQAVAPGSGEVLSGGRSTPGLFVLPLWQQFPLFQGICPTRQMLSGFSSTSVFAPSLMLLEALPTALFLFADGNYEKAIECAKTYLLFFPTDEVMNQNLAYYTAVLGESLAGPIQPREVSKQLVEMSHPRPLQRLWGLP